MYPMGGDLLRRWGHSRNSDRELLKQAGRLGLGGTSESTALGGIATRALAESGEFDWKRFKGVTLRLLLSRHPYATALTRQLEHFRRLTGINVVYDVFPEQVFFDQVGHALHERSSQCDVFMTGAYQTWQYGPAGELVDLNDFLNDPALTAPGFDWNDILPNLRAATAWSGRIGDPLGGPGAKQWALPLGFELNCLSYNQAMLDRAGITAPTSLPDLREKAAAAQRRCGTEYGIGVRGSRSWATIHSGFLSGYTNYGARDFEFENGRLRSAMNSPAAKEYTRLWMDMVRESGPADWPTYSWYDVLGDLGTGRSVFVYDADCTGFFQNRECDKAGDLAYRALVANPAAEAPTSNLWVWSLAMSAFSPNKAAAWLFMQWATSVQNLLECARRYDFVDPVRESVANDETLRRQLRDEYPGYLAQYDANIARAQIYFTPQPLFFSVTTQWAATLQAIYRREVNVDEGLDQLAERIDAKLAEAAI